MSDIKFALTSIKKNFRNEKELRISFLISILGMVLNNIAFLIIWYYFGKTIGIINGWEPLDILGLFAFSGISYGLVETPFQGIFKLPTYIASGVFDKFLTTPKNILIKVSTSALSTSAIGDLLYGLVCFVMFAIFRKLTVFQLFLAFSLMIITSIIYYSFSLICMSISFYLMEGENVSEGLHNLFLSNSLYHGGAFTGALRFIFIFLIPSLLLGAVPVEIIINMSLIQFIMIILLTIFWFILSILFFYKSIRKYESNNFFGFGH